MVALRLVLLGGFQAVSCSGTPIIIGAKKAKALLAYLALYPGQACSREKLAALLWEESSDVQARHSLRQALASLRKALAAVDSPVLNADSDTLRIVPHTLEVDVFDFERLVEKGSPRLLAQAIELYQGEFLEGFNPRAVAFESWLMAERSRLREGVLGAMTKLLAHHLASGAVEPAIRLSIHLLTLDPLRESVHRTLMELYAQQRRWGAALKQYRICRGILQRELRVAPEPETEQLYQKLLQIRHTPSLAIAAWEAQSPQVEKLGETASQLKNSPEEISITVRPTETAWSAGEFRQATLLFISLAHFSFPEARLEPEARHHLLSRYFSIVAGEVQRYGGRVVTRLNDTAMAAFGVPLAHSNDSERAVRAAWAIQHGLAELGMEKPSAPLRARIGIASGQVVAGQLDGAHHWEATLTGEAVSLAAHLATRAIAGEILITDAVYRSISTFMLGEPLADDGDLEAAALPVWRVRAVYLGKKEERLRFVGRRNECRQFSGAIEACLEAGGGQTFFVRGEAGIGKTQLTEEFIHIAQAQGFACHKALVLDFGVGTGQDAIRMLVRSLLGVGSDSSIRQLQKIAKGATEAGLIAADQEVFLGDLLNLPPPAEYKVLYDAMNNAARHRAKQALVSRLIEAISHQQPVLLVVEDIHWADSVTLAYLAKIAATMNTCCALLVMTSRVEGEPLDAAWRSAMQEAPLTTMDLGPLRPKEALALADQWGEVDTLCARRCIERSGGNPFFLEQLLRAESAGDGRGVPDSIQSLVWARLDRLEFKDKQAIQAASVMGQRFSLAALRFVLADPHYRCERLIEQHWLRPDEEDYLFAHALILEGVYCSLLPSKRRELHRRAAEWFRLREVVLFAEHLDRAEDREAPNAYLRAAQALAAEYYYERAAQLAKRGLALAADPATKYQLTCLYGELLREMGAIDSSIATFRGALKLANQAVSPYRSWMGIAAGLRIQDCYTEALEALDKAEQAAGPPPQAEQLAQVYYHRGNILFPLGRIDDCLRAHEQALHFAAEAGSALLEAYALSGLGDAYYQRGWMITAHGYFDRCVTLCREQGLGRVEVANLAMRGITHFYRNEMNAAVEDNQAAITMATRIEAQREEILARGNLAAVLIHIGEGKAAKQQIEEGLALARDLGAKRFIAGFLQNLGSALAASGRRFEAETCLQDAYALIRESGAAFIGPWVLGSLALVTSDTEQRHWALREGERLLRGNSVSHNFLHFYPNAIEAALEEKDWCEAQRYAALLEEYTRLEPLPWADFFIARGRVLAVLGAGVRDSAMEERLRQLYIEARRANLKAALPALGKALEAVKA